ncbi:PLEIOTROPIC DRUG RESISTANCE PROTEIN 3-LIKE [Salix purpurea]|uniref:PLEIOTROPIC DRUG RESISTANCE PROTEIN 3-LIKE n=1 Tax=Salix purpurea TaxID=77065 RepID=A0A9Q1A772_SALPP|nr:PLEIOTROPIC DRUG RESISTANCE PROTEIN 3-LIKE [Salix purpurea]KAJ6760407.1 PLEIOTROPIC DRUG RESISTANCE PROTEIN 3-LIKE [Salix purpurea]KAJ6760408.1 PLEIOTROPIC DRUG RESISTANCE PROTEIN 3-LIKE [Salix purpurea]
MSYNGHKLEEFVPQKSSAYVSQYDLHIPEMTVRETIDFSARCQGTGSRAEIMMEVSRREKQAGILPDSDVDAYMKAISVEGLKSNLQTDYILKILGLDICADTMAGDAMRRGISGGQKKRLTTVDSCYSFALLQVISRKDQGQYWFLTEQPYSYVSVDQFGKKFKESQVGKNLEEEISKPFDKSKNQKGALSLTKYSLTKWELFKACSVREISSDEKEFFYICIQNYTAIDHCLDNNDYGFPETQMTVSRLAVFYKHRELCFYPAWAYAIPSAILKVPVSLLEAFVWTTLTYYVIGYSPEFGRFLRQFPSTLSDTLDINIHVSVCCIRLPNCGCFNSSWFSHYSNCFSIWWLRDCKARYACLTVNEFLAPRWEKVKVLHSSIQPYVVTLWTPRLKFCHLEEFFFCKENLISLLDINQLC